MKIRNQKFIYKKNIPKKNFNLNKIKSVEKEDKYRSIPDNNEFEDENFKNKKYQQNYFDEEEEYVEEDDDNNIYNTNYNTIQANHYFKYKINDYINYIEKKRNINEVFSPKFYRNNPLIRNGNINKKKIRINLREENPLKSVAKKICNIAIKSNEYKNKNNLFQKNNNKISIEFNDEDDENEEYDEDIGLLEEEEELSQKSEENEEIKFSEETNQREEIQDLKENKKEEFEGDFDEEESNKNNNDHNQFLKKDEKVDIKNKKFLFEKINNNNFENIELKSEISNINKNKDMVKNILKEKEKNIQKETTNHNILFQDKKLDENNAIISPQKLIKVNTIKKMYTKKEKEKNDLKFYKPLTKMNYSEQKLNNNLKKKANITIKKNFYLNNFINISNYKQKGNHDINSSLILNNKKKLNNIFSDINEISKLNSSCIISQKYNPNKINYLLSNNFNKIEIFPQQRNINTYTYFNSKYKDKNNNENLNSINNNHRHIIRINSTSTNQKNKKEDNPYNIIGNKIYKSSTYNSSKKEPLNSGKINTSIIITSSGLNNDNNIDSLKGKFQHMITVRTTNNKPNSTIKNYKIGDNSLNSIKKTLTINSSNENAEIEKKFSHIISPIHNNRYYTNKNYNIETNYKRSNYIKTEPNSIKNNLITNYYRKKDDNKNMERANISSNMSQRNQSTENKIRDNNNKSFYNRRTLSTNTACNNINSSKNDNRDITSDARKNTFNSYSQNNNNLNNSYIQNSIKPDVNTNNETNNLSNSYIINKVKENKNEEKNKSSTAKYNNRKYSYSNAKNRDDNKCEIKNIKNNYSIKVIKDIKSEKTKTIQNIQNNFTYFSQNSSPSKSVSQNNTEKRRTSFKPNHIYRSRRKIDNEENKKESENNKEIKNNAFSNEKSNKSKNLEKNISNNESNKNNDKNQNFINNNENKEKSDVITDDKDKDKEKSNYINKYNSFKNNISNIDLDFEANKKKEEENKNINMDQTKENEKDTKNNTNTINESNITKNEIKSENFVEKKENNNSSPSSSNALPCENNLKLNIENKENEIIFDKYNFLKNAEISDITKDFLILNASSVRPELNEYTKAYLNSITDTNTSTRPELTKLTKEYLLQNE